MWCGGTMRPARLLVLLAAIACNRDMPQGEHQFTDQVTSRHKYTRDLDFNGRATMGAIETSFAPIHEYTRDLDCFYSGAPIEMPIDIRPCSS